ncbi:OB-fold protein [Methylotenera sp. G11]|uniref:OB-fold protein n=1 Tax=Methylotenera sp. G11 TaxID=1506585 RepID=UPI000647EF53|nr:hypothetical protein [Methylotenera sp. G11]
MTKMLKWLGIIFLVLIVIGMIAGKKEGVKEEGNTSSSNELVNNNTEAAKYVLNEKEKKVFNAMLQDDVDSFLDGGDSMLSDGLIVTTSLEVAKAYEDNQVGADQKYYKKDILISGKIEGINSGLGNEPYITLNGTNPFLAPQIHFDNPNIDKIASLSKGQKMTFVCMGNGAVVSAPMFKDCQLAEEFVINKIEKIKPQVQEFLRGEKPRTELVGKLTFISIAVARLLPDNSKCYSGGKNCAKEIQELFDKTPKEDMKKIHTEMQQLGLKV